MTMARTSQLALALALVATSLPQHLADAPTVAHAEREDAGTRAAKRAFEKAEKLFALGKFEDALEQYEKAYEAKPIPDFLFNIGQCHRNLGDYEAAIFSFKKFLRLSPDAPNRDEVQELIDELEEQQARGESRRLRVDRKRATDPDPDEDIGEREGRPAYKKWWFWTAVAAVGVGAGVGIYLATRDSGPPDTSLGNIAPPP